MNKHTIFARPYLLAFGTARSGGERLSTTRSASSHSTAQTRLIGQQVQAAPMLDRLDLEVIPTGYLLVDGGLPTTASYISQTAPLPAHKPEIAVATALAGKYLGMQLLYLDAGSGARNPVSPEMVRQVKKATRLPLLVGGGIRTPDQASVAARAGADVIVIGTVAEQDISILPAMVQAVHSSLHLAG